MAAKSGNMSAADHMDGIYRYQRYIYDLTRKPYLLGRDRILGELKPPAGSNLLEVGCGTARNLIHAAKLYPTSNFYGFDVSSAMLQTAGKAVKKARLSDRIKLAQGDATNFDPTAEFGVRIFERVYISYALSMIPPWKEALAHSFKQVAPGGALYIADFGQQEKMPATFRALLFAWLRQFDVHPIPNLREELDAFASANGAVADFKVLYRGYTYIAEIKRTH